MYSSTLTQISLWTKTVQSYTLPKIHIIERFAKHQNVPALSIPTFRSPGYQALSYASHALMDLEDARLLSKNAIAMLNVQSLPHHCSAHALPMNFVFGLAIHLHFARLLSWICLPLLVRRKEEHPHIGGSTRTWHGCLIATCNVFVCL